MATYIVNTNYKNDAQCERDMLVYRMAATYEGSKTAIERFEKGDTVFLYGSGEGIMAYGTADGVLRKADYNDVNDNEYYMHLDDFKKVSPVMTAHEVKDAIDKELVFRMALFSISENERDAILAEISAKRLAKP